jgi:transmembrane sensor
MQITDTLIKKFLDNQCNATEAAAVAAYLKKHPERLEMYLSASWDAAGKETSMPDGYAEKMLEVIRSQMGRGRMLMVKLRWTAAAAAVLLLMTTVLFFMRDTTSTSPTIAAVKNTRTSNWKQHTNTSKKAYTIKLEDGSVVKLGPQALIRYPEPFEKGKRNIYMDGEADFDVAHDATRPFTVHTKLFSTTALGTSFKVAANAAECRVKLFTGKVVVKALVANLKGWKQDIILLPGHQMKYNLVKGIVAIEAFHNTPKPEPHPKTDILPNDDQEEMVFDNTPLPDVINALIQKYHTPIEYEAAQLKGKYFSGAVLKYDSLSVLLKVIANMNALQVTQKDNGYIISKSR